MSRIEMIQPEEADADVARFYEATTAMLGRVPHSMRVLAKTPHVAKAMLPFIATLQREGGGSLLKTKVKEMVVIKTSHLNGCAY